MNVELKDAKILSFKIIFLYIFFKFFSQIKMKQYIENLIKGIIENLVISLSIPINDELYS